MNSSQTGITRLDPILGPVLKAHAVKPPGQQLLAVATRALTVTDDTGEILAWLKSRAEPGSPLSRLVSARTGVSAGLIAQAKTHLDRSSEVGALSRARIKAARRGVAHLLTDRDTFGYSHRRIIAAKAVTAVVTNELLASISSSGFDTALITWTRLGLAMGVGEATAKRSFETAEDLKWLSVVSSRGAGSKRVRLHRLNARSDKTAWEYAGTVADLSSGADVTDQLGGWILSAASPLWGYSDTKEITYATWLVGLSELTGVDMGFSRRAYKTRLDALRKYFGEQWADISLQLPAVEAMTGADVRFREAQIEYRAKADARKVAIESVRAEQSQARDAVMYLLKGKANRVPEPDDIDAIELWGPRLQKRWADMQAPASMYAPVTKQLAKAIVNREHWEPEDARAVAEMIIGVVG